jgi:hypothetical protein
MKSEKELINSLSSLNSQETEELLNRKMDFKIDEATEQRINDLVYRKAGMNMENTEEKNTAPKKIRHKLSRKFAAITAAACVVLGMAVTAAAVKPEIVPRYFSDMFSFLGKNADTSNVDSITAIPDFEVIENTFDNLNVNVTALAGDKYKAFFAVQFSTLDGSKFVPDTNVSKIEVQIDGETQMGACNWSNSSSDNIYTCSVIYTGEAPLQGKELTVSINNLEEQVIVTGGQTIKTSYVGDYKAKIKLDYVDTTKVVEMNHEFLGAPIQKLEISNLSAHFVVASPLSNEMMTELFDNLNSNDLIIVMKDGSTVKLSNIDHNFVDINPSSLDFNFCQPIDANNIEKIILGDAEFPVE